LGARERLSAGSPDGAQPRLSSAADPRALSSSRRSSREPGRRALLNSQRFGSRRAHPAGNGTGARWALKRHWQTARAVPDRKFPSADATLSFVSGGEIGMATCPHCGLSAGLFRKEHPACRAEAAAKKMMRDEGCTALSQLAQEAGQVGSARWPRRAERRRGCSIPSRTGLTAERLPRGRCPRDPRGSAPGRRAVPPCLPPGATLADGGTRAIPLIRRTWIAGGLAVSRRPPGAKQVRSVRNRLDHVGGSIRQRDDEHHLVSRAARKLGRGRPLASRIGVSISNATSNNRVNATGRPVTPLACASGAPVRPARYAVGDRQLTVR